MPSNNTIHITYIGRLVREKGIEIVLECIQKSISEERNIVWHICGNGTYMGDFQKIKHPGVVIYGYVEKVTLREIFAHTDLVMMPSLFLETFGLVALESLVSGVPVCGFAKGGLRDFIHPTLAMDPLDPVESFFSILDAERFPVLDVSNFSYDLWLLKLKELTEGSQKILLVNDYTRAVGGAEEYVMRLRDALVFIGKEVEIFGYEGKSPRWIRILLMLLAPFAFWRGFLLKKKINELSPDLIWMHSILRYVGPHGLLAISTYQSKKYITHHDLGLITLRPSQIYNETDIPVSPNLGDWIPKKIHVFFIVSAAWKWMMISWIWTFLIAKDIIHIVPSEWMIHHLQKYIPTIPHIFPHTIKNTDSVK